MKGGVQVEKDILMYARVIEAVGKESLRKRRGRGPKVSGRRRLKVMEKRLLIGGFSRRGDEEGWESPGPELYFKSQRWGDLETNHPKKYYSPIYRRNPLGR